MTRQEQLKARLAKQEMKLAKERQEKYDVAGALRTEERRLLNRRRYAVGAIADESGLLDLENATLTCAFSLIARLVQQGALADVLAIYPPEDAPVVAVPLGELSIEEMEEVAGVSGGK